MKKVFKYCLSVLTLLLAMSWAVAQPSGAKPLTDAEKTTLLSALSNSFQSVQCDFRQEKKSALFNESSVSEGVMYFKKPSSLRWEYKSPVASVIMMNGNDVKVIDATGKEQSKGGQMYRQLASLIAGVVSGKELENGKNFKSEFYGNATCYWIKLTPTNRRLKAFFSHIEMTVDKQKRVAVKMLLSEKEGDSTTITFSNHKVNTAIDSKLFNTK
ncbi:MAG: outer membrane lipoprotein carrier protein LolA [Bacteroidales bacterium]|nr:outer membrane lipoprotein carrier protein LolA [Bacteroidales bacterium]